MQDPKVLPCHWEQRIMCPFLGGVTGRYPSVLLCSNREMERMNWRHQITMQLKPPIMRWVLSNSPHHKVGWAEH